MFDGYYVNNIADIKEGGLTVKKVKTRFLYSAWYYFTFTYSVYAGFATQYGDIKTIHIKGLKDIRLGIDIRGGVDVSFSPDNDVNATDAELDSAYGGYQGKVVKTKY